MMDPTDTRLLAANRDELTSPMGWPLGLVAVDEVKLCQLVTGCARVTPEKAEFSEVPRS